MQQVPLTASHGVCGLIVYQAFGGELHAIWPVRQDFCTGGGQSGLYLTGRGTFMLDDISDPAKAAARKVPVPKLTIRPRRTGLTKVVVPREGWAIDW